MREAKVCEKCEEATALSKERFCKVCRRIALQEMKDAGYLTPTPGHGTYRPPDAMENTRDTKFGTGH